MAKGSLAQGTLRALLVMVALMTSGVPSGAVLAQLGNEEAPVVSVAPGEQKTVTLPDGSILKLEHLGDEAPSDQGHCSWWSWGICVIGVSASPNPVQRFSTVTFSGTFCSYTGTYGEGRFVSYHEHQNLDWEWSGLQSWYASPFFSFPPGCTFASLSTTQLGVVPSPGSWFPGNLLYGLARCVPWQCWMSDSTAAWYSVFGGMPNVDITFSIDKTGVSSDRTRVFTVDAVSNGQIAVDSLTIHVHDLCSGAPWSASGFNQAASFDGCTVTWNAGAAPVGWTGRLQFTVQAPDTKEFPRIGEASFTFRAQAHYQVGTSIWWDWWGTWGSFGNYRTKTVSNSLMWRPTPDITLGGLVGITSLFGSEPVTAVADVDNRGIPLGHAFGVTTTIDYPDEFTLLEQDGTGADVVGALQWSENINASTGRLHHAAVQAPSLDTIRDYSFMFNVAPHRDFVDDVFPGRAALDDLRVFPGTRAGGGGGGGGGGGAAPAPELRIVQLLPKLELIPGELLRITLTISNLGAAASQGTRAIATVPADFKVTDLGGATRDLAGNLVFNIGDLAADGSASVSYEVEAPAKPQDTNYVFAARAEGSYSDGGALRTAGAGTAGALLVKGLRTDFRMTHTADVAEIASGGQLTLRIKAENPGQTTLSVALKAQLPDGWSVVSADGATATGSIVSWAAESLAPGASVEKSYKVQAPNRRESTDFVFFASAGVTDQFGLSFTSGAIAKVKVKGVTGILEATRTASKFTLTPREAQDGELVTLTLTLKNTGDGKVTDASIKDAIPAGWSVADAGTGSVAGSTIAFNVGTIEPGATASVSYKVKPPVVSQDTDFAFVADITWKDLTGSTFAAKSVLVLKVQGIKVNLQATKSVVPSLIGEAASQRGDASTVSITLKNAGTADLVNLVVKDIVDNDLAVTGVGQGGSASAGTVSWSVASLKAGQSTTLSYTIVPSIRKQDTDYLLATDVGFQDVLANSYRTNAFATLTTKGLKVDLVVTKSATRTTMEADESSRLTLTLRNAGTAILTNVRVSVPIDTELVAMDLGGGTLSGGVLTFPTITRLDPGQAKTLDYEVQATIRKQATTYELLDTILFTDPFGEEHKALGFARLEVLPVPVLSIALGKEAPPHKATKTSAISIALSNAADRAVEDVAVELPLPEGWSPHHIADFGSYDEGRKMLRWVVDLAATSSFSTTVVLTAPYVQQLTGYEFQATADFAAPFQHDAVSARLGLDLDPIPVLVMEHSSSVREQRGTQPVSFSIKLTNTGGAPAVGVSLLEHVPGWEVVARSITMGGLLDARSHEIAWGVSSIAPGESVAFRFTAITPELELFEPQPFLFAAKADYTDKDRTELPEAFGRSPVLAEPIPDLSTRIGLDFNHDRPQVYAHKGQTWSASMETRAGWGNKATIGVFNAGWADAGAIARVGIPAGFRVYEVSEGARLSADGREVVFQTTLPGQEFTSFSFTFAAPVLRSSQPESFEFPLTITYSDPDGNPQPTRKAAGTITVLPIPELSMKRTAGEERLPSGKRVRVDIHVDNVGFSNAFDVRVADALDQGLSVYAETIEASKPATISLDSDSNTVRWGIASMAPGERVSLSYYLRAESADALAFRPMVAAGSYEDAWGGSLPGNVFPPLVRDHGIAVRPLTVGAWSGVFGYDRLLLDTAQPFLDAAAALKAEVEQAAGPLSAEAKAQLEAQAAALRAAAEGLAQQAKAAAEEAAAQGSAQAQQAKAEAEALIARARSDASEAIASADAAAIAAIAQAGAARDEAAQALITAGQDALARAAATLEEARGGSEAAVQVAIAQAQALRATALEEVGATVAYPEGRVAQVQGIAEATVGEVAGHAARLAAEATALAEALRGEVEQIPPAAQAKVDEAVAAASAMAEALKAEALANVERAQAEAMALATQLQNTAQEIVDSAPETAAALVAMAEALQAFAEATAGEAIAEAGRTAAALQAQIEQLPSQAQEQVNEAAAAATALANALQEAALEEVARAQAEAMALATRLQTEAQEIVDSAPETAAALVAMAEALKAFAEATAADAIEQAGETAARIQDEATRLAAALAEEAGRLPDRAVQAVNDAVAQAQAFAEEAQQLAAETAARIGEEAARLAAQAMFLAERVVAAAQALPDQLVEQAGEVVAMADMLVAEAIMAAMYAARDAVMTAEERLADAQAMVAALPDQAMREVAAAMATAGQALTEAQDAAMQAVAEAQAVPPRAIAEAKAAFQGLASFAPALAEDARSAAIAEVLPGVIAAGSEASDGLFAAASAAGAGAIAGIGGARTAAGDGLAGLRFAVATQFASAVGTARGGISKAEVTIAAASLQAQVSQAELAAAASVPLVSDTMDEAFADALFNVAGIRPVILHTRAGVATAAGAAPEQRPEGFRVSDVTGITPGGIDAVPMAIDAIWLGNFGTDFEAHLEPFLGAGDVEAVRNFVQSGGVLVATDVTLVNNPGLAEILGVSYEGYLHYARDSPAMVSIGSGTGEHPALGHRATEGLAGSKASASAHRAQLTLLDSEKNLYSGFIAKVSADGAEVLATLDQAIEGLGAKFTPLQVADEAATPAFTLAAIAAGRAADAGALAAELRSQALALPVESIGAEAFSALDSASLTLSFRAADAEQAFDGLRVSLMASAALQKQDAAGSLLAAIQAADAASFTASSALSDAAAALAARAAQEPESTQAILNEKAAEIQAIADALPGQVTAAVDAAKAQVDATANAVLAAAAEEIARATAAANAAVAQVQEEIAAAPGRVEAAIAEAQRTADALQATVNAEAARAVAFALATADEANRALVAAVEATSAAVRAAVEDAQGKADEALLAINARVIGIQKEVETTQGLLMFIVNNPDVIIVPTVEMAQATIAQAQAAVSAVQAEALEQLAKAQEAAQQAADQAEAVADALAEEIAAAPDKVNAKLVELEAEARATAAALEAFANAKAQDLQDTANAAVAQAMDLKANLEAEIATLPDRAQAAAQQAIADLGRAVDETQAFLNSEMARAIAEINANVEATQAMVEAAGNAVQAELAARVTELSAAVDEAKAAIEAKARDASDAALAEVNRRAQEVLDEANKVQTDPQGYAAARIAEAEALAQTVAAQATGEAQRLAVEAMATLAQIRAMATDASLGAIAQANGAAAGGLETAGGAPGFAGAAVSGAVGEAIGGIGSAVGSAEEAQRALLAKVEELAFLALAIRDATAGSAQGQADALQAAITTTATGAIGQVAGQVGSTQTQAQATLQETAAQLLAKAAEVRSILEAEIGARAVFASQRVLHPDGIAAGSPAVTVNGFGAGQAVLFTPALEGPWSTGQTAASWVLFGRQAAIPQGL